MGVYAVPGSGDALAPTTGAASRPGEFCAIAEHETAVLTRGGFQNEVPGSIPCDSLHDMPEMIFHLPLRNAEELRELIGG